jgi:hypothetical protein
MLPFLEALNKSSRDGSVADVMRQALRIFHDAVGQTQVDVSACADDVALIGDVKRLVDTNAGVCSDLQRPLGAAKPLREEDHQIVEADHLSLLLCLSFNPDVNLCRCMLQLSHDVEHGALDTLCPFDVGDLPRKLQLKNEVGGPANEPC